MLSLDMRLAHSSTSICVAPVFVLQCVGGPCAVASATHTRRHRRTPRHAHTGPGHTSRVCESNGEERIASIDSLSNDRPLFRSARGRTGMGLGPPRAQGHGRASAGWGPRLARATTHPRRDGVHTGAHDARRDNTVEYCPHSREVFTLFVPRVVNKTRIYVLLHVLEPRRRRQRWQG